MRLFFSISILLTAPCLQAQVCEIRLLGPDLDGNENQGQSVALDGSICVSGAPKEGGAGQDIGAAYVHLQDGSGLWSVGPKIQPAGLPDRANFGTSVDLDGDLLVVGAPGLLTTLTTDPGAAFVYETTDAGATWNLLATLTPSDGVVNDRFGFDVAVCDGTILVGAPNHDGPSLSTGAVYVFERSGSSVTEVQKLTLANPQGNDRLGLALDLDGDVAAFGLSSKTGGTTSSGTAFVFERSGGIFTEQQQLNASNASIVDLFGTDVAVRGDLLVCGAPGEDSAGSAAGAAYVFRLAGGVWSEVALLVGSASAAGDNLGTAVSTDGVRVAVGAPGAGGGEAYVFADGGGSWIENRRVRPMLTGSGSFAGTSLELSGDSLLMGDPADDSIVFNNGASYLVEIGGVDSDGDGFTDSRAGWGQAYCSPAVANSTGGPGTIRSLGSPVALDGLLELHAADLPNFQFAYFLASQTTALIVGPGGSQGNLCLGGSIGRFNAQVGGTNAMGEFSIVVDTRNLPDPLPAVVAGGQTWNFQCWYRDSNPSATSNFTDAVQHTFL